MSRGADPHDFQRWTRRPVCTECGAQFTDERWKAVERTGWGVLPQEANPSLCECDQRDEVLIRDAWWDRHPQQEQEQEQEQEQALPEQKAGGWLSRFRPGQTR
ncbi:hypothetical protein ACFXEL_29775 [Streptomyces sp. NPDC059382]|uniref:hypothetical protein n=1 Tax=Streptomyces sp. NPDC059382 TaxID=3346816 RepID=UPI0036B99A2B